MCPNLPINLTVDIMLRSQVLFINTLQAPLPEEDNHEWDGGHGIVDNEVLVFVDASDDPINRKLVIQNGLKALGFSLTS